MKSCKKGGKRKQRWDEKKFNVKFNQKSLVDCKLISRNWKNCVQQELQKRIVVILLKIEVIDSNDGWDL